MSFGLLIRVLSPRDGRCIESSSTLYVLFKKKNPPVWQSVFIFVWVKLY